MADENYKLGTDRDALIDELNKEFSDYTINVGFEKGKVLWLEVARKENPRMMYYTDKDSFVENKPAGFDSLVDQKTVEWTEVTTRKPAPENPVHINPFEYPAGRIGQETPAPDVDETEPVTEPAVTTVSEETVTLPETTTTVTTVAEAVNVPASSTTVETKASESESSASKETEAPVSDKDEDSDKDVTTTHPTLNINVLDSEDDQVKCFAQKYNLKDDDFETVKINEKSKEKYKIGTTYNLGDFGYNWENLTGIGVTFSSTGEHSGAQIFLGNENMYTPEKIENNYCFVYIDQYKLKDPPATIKVNAWNMGQIDDLVFYFDKPKAPVISPESVLIKGVNGQYYMNNLENKNFKSLTIVYKNNAYGSVGNEGRSGTVYFDTHSSTVDFKMTRENNRVVTVEVDNPEKFTYFGIESSSRYVTSEEIEAVYVNY